jgi:hypothetical protein
VEFAGTARLVSSPTSLLNAGVGITSGSTLAGFDAPHPIFQKIYKESVLNNLEYLPLKSKTSVVCRGNIAVSLLVTILGYCS